MSTDFNMFLSDDKKNEKVFSESINDSRSEYKIDDTEYAIYLTLLNNFDLEKVLNLFQFQELIKMKKLKRITKLGLQLIVLYQVTQKINTKILNN